MNAKLFVTLVMVLAAALTCSTTFSSNDGGTAKSGNTPTDVFPDTAGDAASGTTAGSGTTSAGTLTLAFNVGSSMANADVRAYVFAATGDLVGEAGVISSPETLSGTGSLTIPVDGASSNETAINASTPAIQLPAGNYTVYVEFDKNTNGNFDVGDDGHVSTFTLNGNTTYSISTLNGTMTKALVFDGDPPPTPTITRIANSRLFCYFNVVGGNPLLSKAHRDTGHMSATAVDGTGAVAAGCPGMTGACEQLTVKAVYSMYCIADFNTIYDPAGMPPVVEDDFDNIFKGSPVDYTIGAPEAAIPQESTNATCDTDGPGHDDNVCGPFQLCNGEVTCP